MCLLLSQCSFLFMVCSLIALRFLFRYRFLIGALNILSKMTFSPSILFFMFMLLQLFPFFPLCPPPLSPSPNSLRQSPSCCPCPWVMHICVLWTLCSLCCTLHPHDYSVTTNLYFLILAHFLRIPQTPLPSRCLVDTSFY